ncbi:MAG TPA: sigma-70 family RNA polymerase sigma factor [Blastocatellia bacterium]|nr:sigma-70 family RNA polymerase sigma factor [Blastocatellia bacterium]
MTSEHELIKRAQAGDQEAFCLLAQGYERRLYALALYYCRDSFDAEDLSQEVWLKAYRSISSFRGESSFYTWLRQIAVNTFLNQKREETSMGGKEQIAIRLGRVVSLDELGLGTAEPAIEGESVMHQQIMAGRVMEALDELTPQQRLIFLLKHREGMTYEEISSAVGTSTGTIKKALFRAVAKLREFLGVKAGAESYTSLAASENN